MKTTGGHYISDFKMLVPPEQRQAHLPVMIYIGKVDVNGEKTVVTWDAEGRPVNWQSTDYYLDIKPITNEIGLHHGAMADSYLSQFVTMGLKFKAESLEEFQGYFEALFRLRLGGILIDSIYSKGLKKLHDKIIAHARKMNKPKPVKNA